MRAASRIPSEVRWDGQRWTGTCEGAHGEHYAPHISLAPRRAFNCDCKDRARSGRVGPCKHVIALAAAGLASMGLDE